MTDQRPFGAANFADYGLRARLSLVLEQVREGGSERLPSEAELCRRLEVGRPALHRVLLGLEREGSLHQVRRKGWYFPAPKLEIPVGPHNSYTANMLRQNRRPHSELLGIDQGPADDPEPAGFFPRGSGRLWFLDFRRYDGDLPLSLARVRLPVDLTPGLNRHLGADVSLYLVLERDYGIRPVRRSTWCEALAADPETAAALQVTPASPLLKTTHQALWQGRPFEHTVNLLRGDASRVRVDLVEPADPSR